MATPEKRMSETLWHLATTLSMQRITDWLEITEEDLRDVCSNSLRLSVENTKRVIDLGFIYDSLVIDNSPSVAVSWLEGNNLRLNGARPLDAVWCGKTDEVYRAVMALSHEKQTLTM